MPWIFLLLAWTIPWPSARAQAEELSAARWIYLRGGAPPALDERLVEVIAAGDVMPGRGLAGMPGIFDRVASELGGADLAIANLEGAITTTSPVRSSGPLLIPPAAAASLAGAGFDLLGLANNHALDAGAQGLIEMARLLGKAGIQTVKDGESVVQTSRGLKIAFLAWNEFSPKRDQDLPGLVRSLHRDADIVIVLAHWGQEYQRHPDAQQRRLAGQLLEAGADIILGSHPHVVQDVQLVPAEGSQAPARLVAFSLGNFAFDQGWDDTGQGLALRLLLDGRGLRAAQALPLWTAPRPRWMTEAEAAHLLDRALPAKRVGFTCSRDTCQAVQVPQVPRDGRFWSGAIDLTGDGQPEIVRRQREGVEIYQDGQLVWRSPPEWRVHDAALGDPNEDGRYELLLALEKAGSSGIPAYHPFIVGYRGGIYGLLWGGSAVSAPLLEVELGDLDSDGRDDLAAIEAAEDGVSRYLAVWRWHGWGFSLAWRSPAGDYHDLVILPAGDGLPARLSAAASP